jgi:hypothetical protein
MVQNSNVNNNASVVVVGRTAPVPPGQQPMSRSLPVVLASDQTPVPVVEQNKVLSEVSLSLLGIPRSETALGIFADVNTYDVNPSEWSAEPAATTVNNMTPGIGGNQTWGLNHLPTESGAIIQAPANQSTTLTSKRFFRYQPGRVSSATFGVKNKVFTDSRLTNHGYPANPTIKKFGIFDKYDGYYWEVRNDGQGDNFGVVRRTQSLNTAIPLPYGTGAGQQTSDYARIGEAFGDAGDLVVMRDGLIHVHAAVYDTDLLKSSIMLNFDSSVNVDSINHQITIEDPLGLLFTGQPVLYKDNGNTDDVGLSQGQGYFVQVISGTTTKVIKLHTAWTLNSAVNLVNQPGSTRTLVLLAENIQFTADLNNPVTSTIELDEAQIKKVTAWLQDTPVSQAPSPDNTMVVLASDQLGLTSLSRYLLKVSDSQTRKLNVYSYFSPTLQSVNTDSGVKNFWRTNFEEDATNVVVDTQDNTIRFAAGTNIFKVRQGQAILATTTSAGLTAGNLYFVVNLQPYETLPAFQVSLSQGGTPLVLSAGSPALLFLIPEPHPFQFPLITGDGASPWAYGSSSAASGMFPYMYLENNNTGDAIAGLVNTQLANTDVGAADIRSQIDTVNQRVFGNWMRDNVDPAYYGVYEYRVPRSRFSHDKLNGLTQPTLYSDSVLGNRPGTPVRTSGGAIVNYTSAWDLDFTKVTMFKVDFSWYGAVGALFLAYVPVGNGEARWLRVHHLRASNQLKVASLGNAFLPITYTVYGGGSQDTWGYVNQDRVDNGYNNSYSEFLVKYGASYYIDGGDRGTTRLYSHSRTDFKSVFGQLSSLDWNYASTSGDPSNSLTDPYVWTTTDISAFGSFFMNSSVITQESDQNVYVTYYSVATVGIETRHRLHINKRLVAGTQGIQIIVDRSSPVFGIQCKDFISSAEGQAVRNRTQIYPAKLSVGVSDLVGSIAVVNLRKTPLYQTKTQLPQNASLQLNVNLPIGNASNPIKLDPDNLTEIGSFLPTFGSLYGWFRCVPVNNPNSIPIPVLGELTKRTDGYWFKSVDAYDVPLLILAQSDFLLEGNYDSKAAQISNTYPTSSLNRLSAILVDTEQRCPIPGTGQNVATLYVKEGGSDFDLSLYFDYNKDYLSFPLTDAVESLYILASSAQPAGTPPTVRARLVASLTWEEQ